MPASVWPIAPQVAAAGAFTVTLRVAVCPSKVQLMVAEPALTAVIVPSELTFTIAGSEEDQEAEDLSASAFLGFYKNAEIKGA